MAEGDGGEGTSRDSGGMNIPHANVDSISGGAEGSEGGESGEDGEDNEVEGVVKKEKKKKKKRKLMLSEFNIFTSLDYFFPLQNFRKNK